MGTKLIFSWTKNFCSC